MKKLKLLFGAFLFIFSQNVLCQITSLSSNVVKDEKIARLHNRIDGSDARFRKFISAPVNGVYTINGYTKGNINDPDSYHGLLISHFDLNAFALELGYASASVAGMPATPTFMTDISISKNAITIKLTDKNILLDSDFDQKTGNAVRPKDPFTRSWGCNSGKRTYDLGIRLKNNFNLMSKVSYTCSHSSTVMSRNGASSRTNAITGKKTWGGRIDYYPPVNFNHTQTITYSITQMAQTLGVTPKEIAALIVYEGIQSIPLNNQNSVWELTNVEEDIIRYCLHTLYSLDDEFMMSVEAKIKNNAASGMASSKGDLEKLLAIKLSPETNAEELRGLAQKTVDQFRKHMAAAIDEAQSIDAGVGCALAQSFLITAYALKKQYKEVERLWKEGLELFGEKMYPYMKFQMATCFYLSSIEEYEKSVIYGAHVFYVLSENPNIQRAFTRVDAADKRQELMNTFRNVIFGGLMAAREGKKAPQDLALMAYREFCQSPVIETNNYVSSMYACELYFYELIGDMQKSLGKKPLNERTYKEWDTFELAKFYNNYSLALECMNSYEKLYKIIYKTTSTENSKGIKSMNNYLQKNFFRTSEEAAFDRKMLMQKFNEDNLNTMIPIFDGTPNVLK
ncbi:MAG: hypothetical protein KBT12_03500 [Bacteroidales bacterium]|nr:hypothetical protein [Candidatus Physcousia equi]